MKKKDKIDTTVVAQAEEIKKELTLNRKPVKGDTLNKEHEGFNVNKL